MRRCEDVRTSDVQKTTKGESNGLEGEGVGEEYECGVCGCGERWMAKYVVVGVISTPAALGHHASLLRNERLYRCRAFVTLL